MPPPPPGVILPPGMPFPPPGVILPTFPGQPQFPPASPIRPVVPAIAPVENKKVVESVPSSSTLLKAGMMLVYGDNEISPVRPSFLFVGIDGLTRGCRMRRERH